MKLDSICQVLSELAPLKRAESWDNVGLIVGDRSAAISAVMTCLTITPNVVDEAVQKGVDLIVAHHPLPFRPLAKITSDSITGSMLWRLIGAQVAVYSAHTAFDSAADGINQTWAESIALESIRPLTEPNDQNDLGAGRYGTLPSPRPAAEIIRQCGKIVGSDIVRAAGDTEQLVKKVGFACGSGGSFVSDASRRGCQLLITGEATFHGCLESEALGVTLGLLGHYQSERFAMERLAERLTATFPDVSIWPSESEQDPISVL